MEDLDGLIWISMDFRWVIRWGMFFDLFWFNFVELCWYVTGVCNRWWSHFSQLCFRGTQSPMTKHRIFQSYGKFIQSGANGNCFRPSLWLESLWIDQRVFIEGHNNSNYSNNSISIIMISICKLFIPFFLQKVRRYPSTWVINTSKVWSK